MDIDIRADGFDFHFPLKAGVHIIHADMDGDESTSTACDLLTSLHATTKAAIASGRIVKAIVLTNPKNPSGLLYSRTHLECVAQFCQSRNLYLIVDEVYALSTLCPISWDFVSVLSLDLQALDVDPARILAVWCTSKDFASSGVRMESGYDHTVTLRNALTCHTRAASSRRVIQSYALV